MADVVFNIAKGRVAYYASLPAASDAIIAIPIESSGVEADATIIDYDTVAALLASTNNENATMGRKTLANVTVTVDDTNNRVAIDADNLTWTAAGGNAISDILFAYDPDTGVGTDADLVPLSFHDFVATPNGVADIVATISDLIRSA